MKIANIVLSVLILLFAAASAVFSYFLFEKRSQFVDGWAKMADSVNKTAVELDNSSGVQKLSDELNSDKLSHRNYAELDSRLPKLAERARQVVISRNALASALFAIGKAVDAQKLPAEKALCGLNTYDAGKDAVIGAVADSIRNRDTQFSRVAKISSDYLKAKVNTNDLKSGKRNALDNMEKALKTDRDRRTKYESGLASIANKVGNKFNSGTYADSVQSIVGSVEKLRVLQRKTADDLRKTQSQVRSQKAQLDKNAAQIKKQTADISKRDTQIKDLKRALGLTPEAEVALWKDGSAEARKALVGKVLQVNNDYGYISIDLGSDSRVLQKVGNRDVKINPQIASGLELVVLDDTLENGGKFVTRVKINEVGKTCSTADIPAGSKSIKSGYMIYWNAAN